MQGVTVGGNFFQVQCLTAREHVLVVVPEGGGEIGGEAIAVGFTEDFCYSFLSTG